MVAGPVAAAPAHPIDWSLALRPGYRKGMLRPSATPMRDPTPEATAPWARPPAPPSPLPTLRRVLEDLGATFLSSLAPVPDLDRHVGGIVVYDPLDAQAMPNDALVLGVGLAPGGDLPVTIAELAARQASAVVLREPAELDEATIEVARLRGVALLGITPGASWMQLSTMIAAMLAGTEDNPAAELIDGLPMGDLFTLANAIASLLDAPITIEDRNSRVLAFSARQDEADPSRVETVLERQVPERYARLLAEAGFFKKLYSSEDPAYIDLTVDGAELKTRCAIAVQAGGEILGSIWAVVSGPLSPERTSAYRDAAKVVALHLLRLRATTDVERRMRADLVSTALGGGDGAAYALERLGVGESRIVVLAAEIRDEDDDTLGAIRERRAKGQRIADAIAMHLVAAHPRASAALIGATVYGLLPVRTEEGGEAHAVRVANDFLTRIGTRTPVSIGIGEAGTGPRGVVRSRESAERALRVQREHDTGAARAALFSDVHVESLVLELRDRIAASGDHPTGAVARLIDHDRRHDTAFVETLRVWLDHLGDVSAAARALHIHANTFRYRLRRLADVGQLDLTDAEARFSAQLQLRIMPELQRRG